MILGSTVGCWWTPPAGLDGRDRLTTALGPGVGRMAPDFALQTLDGGNLRSERAARQAGGAQLLGHLVRALPDANCLPLQRPPSTSATQVVFVGVDQGETAEVVQ